MAQHKYDMLTVDTSKGSSRRRHPWYKERLKLKFLKTSKQSIVLDGSKWKFLPRSVDDFRMGVSLKCSKLMKKKQLNPIPIINVAGSLSKASSCHRQISAQNSGLRTLFNKFGSSFQEDINFPLFRVKPRRQIKLERVNRVESCLLQHPLLLYPHLEESIPIDIVDEVAEILDPAINELIGPLIHTCLFPNDSKTEEENRGERSPDKDKADVLVQSIIMDEQARIYKFPLMKTSEEKERELDLLASKQVISAKQQSKVKQVTHDLVQWGEQLGGTYDSTCAIDEHTIKSLFGSDYESKPILMAPIQVVELTNIPPELLLDSRTQSTYSARSPAHNPPITMLQHQGYKRVRPGAGDDMMPWLIKDHDVPRVVKTKYGAWYLPVGLWKLLSSDEPLDDPKKEAAEMKSDQNVTRMQEMDKRISELHGARAFKNFILTNKSAARMPTFLQSVTVSTIQSHSTGPSGVRRRLH